MKRFPLLMACVCFGGVVIPVSATILFVDDDAMPNGDGATWDTAYRYLQDALHDANSNGGVAEIHVAGGIYMPDQDERGIVTQGDRNVSFALIDGVVLKGGYAGIGSPDPEYRDIMSNVSALSGDLSGNDEVNFSNNDENAYHVLTAVSVCSNGAIDGFTVTGGHANDRNFFGECGGGLLCNNGTVTLRNCEFKQNYGCWGGGGMAVVNGGSSTIHTCVFTDNRSEWGAERTLKIAVLF